MFRLALAPQRKSLTAKDIVAEASAKLHRATSLTFTVTVTSNEHHAPQRFNYAWRRDGRFQLEHDGVTKIENPKRSWAFSPSEKKFKTLPQHSSDLSPGTMVGSDLEYHLPIIGGPTLVRWHGMDALQI
jgi:outer membrane lipoprotein-sorting protein